VSSAGPSDALEQAVEELCSVRLGVVASVVALSPHVAARVVVEPSRATRPAH
jgi:hypothetical protein